MNNSDYQGTIEACKRVDLLALIEPTTRLRKVSAREWAGPCPKCGGNDRFRVNLDHGWFCRVCNGDHWNDAIDFRVWLHGEDWVQATTALVGRRPITRETLEQIQRERDQREKAQLEKELAETAVAQRKMHASGLWKTYHDNLDDHARALWRERGIRDDWMNFYQLGYCPAREWKSGDELFWSDSLTIPYFRWSAPGEYVCISLKHRLLVKDPPGGKYRPEFAGLGNQLFFPWNEERTLNERVLIVEGEIKAMVVFANLWAGTELILIDPTLSVVGVPGKTIKPCHIAAFDGVEQIYICLDPDATDQAERLAGDLGKERCKVIRLPGKVDDLMVMGALDGQTLIDVLEG